MGLKSPLLAYSLAKILKQSGGKVRDTFQRHRKLYEAAGAETAERAPQGLHSGGDWGRGIGEVLRDHTHFIVTKSWFYIENIH